jgi:hypothetical protein
VLKHGNICCIAVGEGFNPGHFDFITCYGVAARPVPHNDGYLPRYAACPCRAGPSFCAGCAFGGEFMESDDSRDSVGNRAQYRYMDLASPSTELVPLMSLLILCAGMVTVAIIFIALKGNLDLRTLGRYCDVLVGIFMMVLGAFGIFSALKTYNDKGKMKSDEDLHSLSETGTHLSVSDQQAHKILFEEEEIDESIKFCSKYLPFLDVRDQFNQRVLSFLIGMLHGVAGPGGILGVLPAVEMQNWRSSSLYLSSFVVASTLSMGGFAAIYGEITKRIGSTQHFLEFLLRAFSSLMSITVGVIWVVLSVLGKLDELFH